MGRQVTATEDSMMKYSNRASRCGGRRASFTLCLPGVGGEGELMEEMTSILDLEGKEGIL